MANLLFFFAPFSDIIPYFCTQPLLALSIYSRPLDYGNISMCILTFSRLNDSK